MRNTIIILFLLAFYSVVCAETTVKMMPDELLKIAAKCDCEQVDDFYNRPGMTEPPYVYGFLPGEQENSAVFWCRKKDENKKYLLVLASRKSFSEDWSYEIIIKTRNYPRGLSIVKNCKISLDNFIYVSNATKRGPKGVFPSSNVLLSTYDGLSDYYYNYKGSWLICQLD